MGRFNLQTMKRTTQRTQFALKFYDTFSALQHLLPRVTTLIVTVNNINTHFMALFLLYIIK